MRSSSGEGSKALERKTAFGLMSFIFLHTGPAFDVSCTVTLGVYRKGMAYRGGSLWQLRPRTLALLEYFAVHRHTRRFHHEQ